MKVEGALGTYRYFAYGSNMLTRRLSMAGRAPSAVPVATGYVQGRRLAVDKVSVDGSGKCDAEGTSRPSDRVFGVVFEIREEDRDGLDQAEGVGYGYARETVNVIMREGLREAVTYIALQKDAGLRPYRWYMDLVIAGALEHGLPMAYVDRLRKIEAVEDPQAERRARFEALLAAT